MSAHAWLIWLGIAVVAGLVAYVVKLWREPMPPIERDGEDGRPRHVTHGWSQGVAKSAKEPTKLDDDWLDNQV